MRRSTLLLALFLVACTTRETDSDVSTVTLLGPDGEKARFQVEVVQTDAERRQGLMSRESLGKNRGMLFVFEDEDFRSFWMKNTLIPLDIFYFDAEGVLVSLRTMQPCEADPCPGYPSGHKAKYALEVNAGVADREGIDIGWTLELPHAKRL